jgi:hypothetical protein
VEEQEFAFLFSSFEACLAITDCPFYLTSVLLDQITSYFGEFTIQLTETIKARANSLAKLISSQKLLHLLKIF